VRDWQRIFPAYNIPVRYQQTPQHEFRQSLEAAMGPVTALDFTEQLMIFDSKWGMIYDNPDFVQAGQVRYSCFAVRVPRVVADCVPASGSTAHHLGEIRGVERSLVLDERGLDVAVVAVRHQVAGLFCWISVGQLIIELWFSDNLS
jgi:hypothetical protein